jgi:ribose transport system substrate-binding protein
VELQHRISEWRIRKNNQRRQSLVKKIISLLFVVLTLSACGGRPDQRKVTIAIVGKAKTPYWDDVKLGAEAAGRDLGVSVKFHAPSKEDPAWQIREIEELTARPVDGIAFAASDPKSIASSILKAMQSEIPCVALDTDVAKSRHAYIGTGNYDAGKQAGERMVSLLEDKGKVAIVAGSSENPDLLQRVRGFRDILAEHPNVEIAATLDSESGVVQTTDVESLLGSHAELDGIFCASDSGGVAAAEAVKKADKVERIKIVCIGESPDIMILVRDKVIQAAVARKPYRIGYLSVLVLHNMARAGIVNTLRILPKSEIIDTGIALVTPLNIVQYREQLRMLGIEVKF